MQTIKRRNAQRRGGIIYLPVDELEPNPTQPRRNFDGDGLLELSRSIAEYGILNPLTVRLCGTRYELVAGERRLRAAKLAGLCDVPCVLLELSMEESGLVALVENLQRRDLDFIEEANGIKQLIDLFGMSQEEAARRLGKSQSAVANKLRLLKLPEELLYRLRDNGLTERHGRALLKLPGDEQKNAALGFIIEHGLNVSETESYIDRLLEGKSESPPPKRLFVMKDVRLFLNTVTHGIELMKQSGVNAELKRDETENELILTVSIPKKSE